MGPKEGGDPIQKMLTFMRRPFTVLFLAILFFYGCRSGDSWPIPRMEGGILVPEDTLSLGLSRCEGAEWAEVHRSDGYVNNAVMTRFKGRYYCMWQESARDEDTPDTRIMYATSADGKSWEAPSTLVPPTEDHFASPGGWLPRGDSLTALVNYIYAPDRSAGGSAYFISTADGQSWTAPRPVLMADGTPVGGIFEQDPLHLPDGRTVGAVHFRPGTTLCPVYTDDPSCVRGWRKARFPEGEGTPLEPSQYLARDGRLVMLFRDQQSSFRKLYAISDDRGASWSAPRLTNIPDSRSKQCAGTLADGQAFWVGNPTGTKSRRALVLALSEDGYLFDRACLLAGPGDLPPRRKEGRYKTRGYNYPKAFVEGNTLWVALTVNKEDIRVVRVIFGELAPRAH